MSAIRTATVVAALAAAAAVPGAPAASPAPPREPVPVTFAAAGEPVAPVVPVAADGDAVPEIVHEHTEHPAPPLAAAPAARKPSGTAPVWDGTAFRTPEAAMRFLVRSYNAHADRALAHVTTPDARRNLVAMRDYAPLLRLTSCTRLDTGAYDCEFTHSVKGSTKWDGFASFRVAPAAKPGWYMTVLLDCGDGETA